MKKNKLPSRSENFSEWYNQLVIKAELADYALVRDCIVIRPYDWALKEGTKATTRCIPLNQPDEEGNCIVYGKPAKIKVYFARAN